MRETIVLTLVLLVLVAAVVPPILDGMADVVVAWRMEVRRIGQPPAILGIRPEP